jgi:DNA polymerase III alpha subunit
MLEQQKVNAVLIQKAKEYGVKVVATNDVHYVAPEDFAVYNIQQCYATGKTMDEFSKTNTLQFRWLTCRKYMCELFSDIPEAIANTMEIYDKVEFYDIRHTPIVPTIDIPNGFGDEKIGKEDAYLEYLSFSKAKQIYGESLPEDVTDRLVFELQIIKQREASFIEGGMRNGHKKNALEKVWNEMERKGMYAFNKSHAVCYNWLAYQMAYLKAHYPEEFKQVIEKYYGKSREL